MWLVSPAALPWYRWVLAIGDRDGGSLWAPGPRSPGFCSIPSCLALSGSTGTYSHKVLMPVLQVTLDDPPLSEAEAVVPLGTDEATVLPLHCDICPFLAEYKFADCGLAFGPAPPGAAECGWCRGAE
mmetsp:Transcript_3581/g.13100  ORF Transcript_3581/g.13100 Transcript_3581/m.13100 type:complete len:127 (+) Transcript_3581:509-889(+)